MERFENYRGPAEQGDADAQFYLGVAYYEGSGVAKDYEEAVKWYRKSAEQGKEYAQIRLADMYYKGEGVPQDYAEAIYWYCKAADQGDPVAQNNLGYAYTNVEAIRDYEEAIKWYRKSIDPRGGEGGQGNLYAKKNLGLMYYNGLGVTQDYAEALKWFRSAEELPEVQHYIGEIYANGYGVPQDYVEAARRYQEAAKHANAFAQNNLGIMYYNGQGVPQDYTLAHKWCNLAAAGFPAPNTKDRDIAIGFRDRVAKLMTPEQIAEAQRLAREWQNGSYRWYGNPSRTGWPDI